MIKTVLLDLDDTLIETQVLYEQARAELATYLRELGIDPGAALEVAKNKSVELMARMGYSKARYPQSFEETLRFFRPDSSPEQIGHVRGLAEAVFTATAKPREGALQFLEILSKEFRLVLITAGDAEVQQKRVNELGCAKLFQEVCIVKEKSSSLLRELAIRAGSSPSEVVVVGDSLRTDIKPAAEAGIRAILVASNNWRMHEVAGHELPAGAIKVDSLDEAAIILIREKLDYMLRLAWSAETSADSKEWSAANPACGQCAVTACVVQDRLGGDIARTAYSTPGGQSGSHYLNLLTGGRRLDLTYGQFSAGTTFVPDPRAAADTLMEATRAYLSAKAFHGSARDYVLSFEQTRLRYELLKERMHSFEVERTIRLPGDSA